MDSKNIFHFHPDCPLPVCNKLSLSFFSKAIFANDICSFFYFLNKYQDYFQIDFLVLLVATWVIKSIFKVFIKIFITSEILWGFLCKLNVTSKTACISGPRSPDSFLFYFLIHFSARKRTFLWKKEEKMWVLCSFTVILSYGKFFLCI